jgi:hypothetical protein
VGVSFWRRADDWLILHQPTTLSERCLLPLECLGRCISDDALTHGSGFGDQSADGASGDSEPFADLGLCLATVECGDHELAEPGRFGLSGIDAVPNLKSALSGTRSIQCALLKVTPRATAICGSVLSPLFQALTTCSMRAVTFGSR